MDRGLHNCGGRQGSPVLHKMKSIPLTRGLHALVDDADFDYLDKHLWIAHKNKRRFYARRRDGKKFVLMHRVIFGAPAKVLVDHRDGDSLNNQRYNLRAASDSQNQMGFQIPRGGSSKFRGVYLVSPGRWRARLQRKRRGGSVSLGIFGNEASAARAYDAAAKRYFKEFASLNFPEEPKVGTI
jgi:hypothetical protein